MTRILLFFSHNTPSSTLAIRDLRPSTHSTENAPFSHVHVHIFIITVTLLVPQKSKHLSMESGADPGICKGGGSVWENKIV
jgi:hypothetical protein